MEYVVSCKTFFFFFSFLNVKDYMFYFVMFGKWFARSFRGKKTRLEEKEWKLMMLGEGRKTELPQE